MKIQYYVKHIDGSEKKQALELILWLISNSWSNKQGIWEKICVRGMA